MTKKACLEASVFGISLKPRVRQGTSIYVEFELGGGNTVALVTQAFDMELDCRAYILFNLMFGWAGRNTTIG